MHGRTHVWLACGLAAAVICATCGVASGQDYYLPARPTDSGYMLATDPGLAAPAGSASQGKYMVSNTALGAEEGDLAGRVAELEAALAQMKAKETAAAASAAGKMSVKAGGRFYVDDVFFGQSAGSMAILGDAQDTLFFRTARLFLEGEGFGVISYKVEFDFAGLKNYTTGPGDPGDHTHGVAGVGVTAFKDVYLAVHDLPWLGTVYVGHFKEPMSLEELTSSRFITFMERSLLNVFAPTRNIGIMAMQVTASENATFAIGVFRTIDDKPPYIADDDHGDAVTLRGTWLPWYDEATEGRGLLHLGLGYTYRDVNNPVQRVRQREEIAVGPYVVDTGDFGNVADIHIFNPEVAFVYGPFSVQTEYMGATYVRDGGAGDAYFDGVYVQVSYFLTGENRVYDRQKAAFTRVRPYENFFRVRDENGYIFTGKGAWELAYRYSYLDLDHPSAGIFGGWDSSHTLGVNWYLNPYTRLMFNYIHSDLGSLDQQANTFLDVFALRAQIDF